MLTELDARFSERFPRCQKCGVPLWIPGNDYPGYCSTCYGVEVKGQNAGTLQDVNCMCGRLAIIDYPMSFINASGTEYTYLEPLCYVCWHVEVAYE